MNVRAFILWSLAALWLASCATAPRFSEKEKQSIQARHLADTSYDSVYRAVKAVLNDEGYIIRESDSSAGIIVATVQKREKASGIWLAVKEDNHYRAGEGFELAVSLQRAETDAVDAHVALKRFEHFSLGGRQVEEILDRKLYAAFYEKVQAELDRRKAAGKR